MASLYDQVMAEVERNERVYGTGADPTHRALKAVVARHQPCDLPNCPDGNLQHCTFCFSGDGFPCEELRTIAVIVGVEVPVPS